MAPRPHQVTLEYRAPFHFDALLAHYRTYRVGDLEVITDHEYARLIEAPGGATWVKVRDDAAHARLILTLESKDRAVIARVTARVRAMFDLDLDPALVDRALRTSPALKRLNRKHPGLRVPSGWDPFEMTITTILGQLVSVPRARALTADLIELLGRASGRTHDGRVIKLFPRPVDIAESDLTGLGTTGARKHTLREFARRVGSGEVSLDPGQDVAAFTANLLSIRGVGPWTASYVAMKVLRDPDAFPHTDLILARALDLHPREHIDRARPWRAYAAVLLWHEYARVLQKPKKVSATKIRK